MYTITRASFQRYTEGIMREGGDSTEVETKEKSDLEPKQLKQVAWQATMCFIREKAGKQRPTTETAKEKIQYVGY